MLELDDTELVTFPFGGGYRLPTLAPQKVGHHVTLVGRGNFTAVYFDTVLLAAKHLRLPWAQYDCKGEIRVGAKRTGDKFSEFFDGFVWDLRVHSVALSLANVAYMYSKSMADKPWATQALRMVPCAVEVNDDEAFRSKIGRDCNWYHEMSDKVSCGVVLCPCSPLIHVRPVPCPKPCPWPDLCHYSRRRGKRNARCILFWALPFLHVQVALLCFPLVVFLSTSPAL